MLASLTLSEVTPAFAILQAVHHYGGSLSNLKFRHMVWVLTGRILMTHVIRMAERYRPPA